jgi:hypothetical protein
MQQNLWSDDKNGWQRVCTVNNYSDGLGVAKTIKLKNWVVLPLNHTPVSILGGK